MSEYSVDVPLKFWFNETSPTEIPMTAVYQLWKSEGVTQSAIDYVKDCLENESHGKELSFYSKNYILGLLDYYYQQEHDPINIEFRIINLDFTLTNLEEFKTT